MQLLIKQRVFSWTDTYDIYDENENKKYYVRAEFFSLGHQLHIYDVNGNEIGIIKEKLFSLLPTFDIEIGAMKVGSIQKKFSLFYPKYEVDVNGWRVEGDFLEWEYDVYEACSPVIHITKKWLSWGDTYVIDIANPSDEYMGLMLVLAIDAANCSKK